MKPGDIVRCQRARLLPREGLTHAGSLVWVVEMRPFHAPLANRYGEYIEDDDLILYPVICSETALPFAGRKTDLELLADFAEIEVIEKDPEDVIRWLVDEDCGVKGELAS